MQNDLDRFWAELVARVGPRPLSQEQAEAELAEAPEEPVSEAEIESLVQAVTEGPPFVSAPSFDERWVPDSELDMAEDAVFQLNRSPGETDPETEQLLDEYRRKGLDDGETDDEEANGVDGGPSPCGDGR